ncbi:MAG: hypothetical protein JWN39_683 [Ilumatobacteraceae bacterium]|nr:hypothetical protein [Ilumatobacteraceae bacterium]
MLSRSPMCLAESDQHEAPVVGRHWAIVWCALIGGGGLIAATLRVQRDSPAFYAAGFGLAAVWILSACAFGRIRLSHPTRVVEDALVGAVLGVLTFGVFVGADEVGRRISFLAGPIRNVLGKADSGSLFWVLALALVNAIAEEMFFRGTLIDALSRRNGPGVSAALSVVLYVAVTAVGGNTALTVAALVMGTVFVAERVLTRGLLAPIVTHLIWSTLVILLLPR